MTLDITITIALIFTGLFISFICSMVGLGGGVLFIPFLILVYGLDPQMSIGTSIFCMTMVTLSATIGYWKNKLVDWRLALAYDIFDIPGIIIGAMITELLPSSLLEIVCGIAIIIVASLVIFKKSKEIEVIGEIEKEKKIVEEYGIKKTHLDEELEKMSSYDVSLAWRGSNFKWVIISSFFGGLVTGMVGLGGGTVDTTTMILLGAPMNIAAGSSSLAMLLTNLVGFSSHASLGNVIWEYALPMGLAAFVGAQIGSRLAPKLDGGILKRILGGVAMCTGIRLLL